MEKKLSLTACEILAYLLANPEARDTLEGIAEWWLLERHIARQVRRIEAALDQLVGEGLLLRREAVDGRARYAVNRQRLEEIRGLVEGTCDEQAGDEGTG